MKRASILVAVSAGIALNLSGPTALLAQDAPALAPPLCDYGEAAPDAAPELEQFDFLIGDYTITGRIWQDGAWGPLITSPRARLTGRYILGGKAIQDEWYDNDPGLNPASTRGMTTRVYDSKAGEWVVSWLSADTPVITDLRVKLEDGVMTMRTVSPETPNYDAYFERTGPGTWSRTAFRTEEDGTRTPLWQAIGTRIPCPEG